MRISILAASVAILLAPQAAVAAPGDELVGQAVAILAGAKAEPRARAVPLLERAAARGNADAQFLLGMLKLRGTVVQPAPEAGRALLGQAAAQGHGEALNALGLLTLHGQGVERDPVRAAGLLRQAADKGVVEAQHQMGWLAETGDGVPKSLAEAVRWYRMAAERGYSRSQYALGLLLAVGAGAERNLPEAVKWLSLAATSPRPDVRGEAEAQIRLVAQGAPADAVSAGQAEARKWLAAKRVF